MEKSTSKPDFPMSEQMLLDAVTELAQWRGFLTYHTHDSRRSQPGFPDLVLLRGLELIVVELKSARGKLSAAQIEWLAALTFAGIETHCWRPEQWNDGTIEARLS